MFTKQIICLSLPIAAACAFLGFDMGIQNHRRSVPQESHSWTVAEIVYGLNQSLDGYVDHLEFRPSPALFRHLIEHVRDLTGTVYGRRTYEVMRYWDEDHPDWDADEHYFAAAWRSQPKWVVSRSLKSVGPNATLVDGDLEK